MQTHLNKLCMLEERNQRKKRLKSLLYPKRTKKELKIEYSDILTLFAT